MKIGDRVKMSADGKTRWPHRGNNPHDLEGKVESVSYSYGAELPILVRWDNGNTNSYGETHLEVISQFKVGDRVRLSDKGYKKYPSQVEKRDELGVILKPGENLEWAVKWDHEEAYQFSYDNDDLVLAAVPEETLEHKLGDNEAITAERIELCLKSFPFDKVAAFELITKDISARSSDYLKNLARDMLIKTSKSEEPFYEAISESFHVIKWNERLYLWYAPWSGFRSVLIERPAKIAGVFNTPVRKLDLDD